ncbi:hypothetical protein J6590_001348 [Homalodisca vitripennis]|nr:hypothetical protein J6590_001348 [Homalodisca vitripennis]
MDKYATLGTLYELKRARRKRRGEMQLLGARREHGTVQSTASSPDLPSLLGVPSRPVVKNRAHSVSACVSQATRCALVICGEEERDRRWEGVDKLGQEERKESKTNRGRVEAGQTTEKAGITKDEKWTMSVQQELMKKEKHSRDCCDCEESAYLKTAISIRVTEPPVDEVALNVEPEPPDNSWLNGSFNAKLLPKKSLGEFTISSDASENRLLSVLRRIRPKTPPPCDFSVDLPSRSPWFQVYSVRRKSRPVSFDGGSRRTPSRPSSPLPSSVIYCARTHLRSFSHIVDKLQDGVHSSCDSVSHSALCKTLDLVVRSI